MSVEPSPPDYSTVIVKEDPPPPYPGFEDAPPPYPGIVSQDITLLISDERDHSNNRGCRCTCTSRPLTPRIVAWCDMILNVPFLILFASMIVNYSPILPVLWIFVFNFPWLVGLYNLHKSADVNLFAEERRELTVVWVKFNYFLLVATGTFMTFILLLVLCQWPIQTRHSSLAFVVITFATIPFMIRLTFCILIYNYTKTI